ncbi:helix-turn-helix transcriptional regulator [Allosediminivita pacifica]|uniref:helix-turn-helix transcriptional regulator n=1 Tax=Allosediminivita pacifica TaxID=1267769 RepID=UPI000D387D66|nr:AlpA family phage regulatory protein [Allosediminivita pacifica]GGB26271.1 hypothetical protein GCM10011324_40090 [Allosediminivita pacifica]
MTFLRENQLDLFPLEPSARKEDGYQESGGNVVAKPAHDIPQASSDGTGLNRERADRSAAPRKAAALRTEKQPRKLFLSDKEVAERYSVSRPTIWRWVKTAPGFPPPVRLAQGTTRWAVDALAEYERNLNDASRAGGAS